MSDIFRRAKFCMDTSCLIEAKNRYYAFDIVPQFWDVLLKACKQDILKMPIAVYEEIMEGNPDDSLVRWAKRHKELLFAELTEKTFEIVKEIISLVYSKYAPHRAEAFLKTRDIDIIAFAKENKLVLVTMEKPKVLTHSAGADGKYDAEVKIPDVCSMLNPPVECIDTFEFLRRLKREHRISM
ncbi:MAG: DUF4411 family protein [Aquificaceae bacterium]|uniref:DUF4411 family protein n=1 Tax=Hydrogenobacter sp. Uz 6-8 TaxID=3384828 RepID=UPI003094C4BA